MMIFNLLTLLFDLTAAFQYGNNHVAVRKDQPQVAANFPDPRVTLLSPAFLNNDSVPEAFANGTEGPTSDFTMQSFLHAVAWRNDWMMLHPVKYVSEEGRSFMYVLLSSDSRTYNSTSYPHSPKVRIWIQGASHGNEPAGDQAILALLGKMDSDQNWTDSMLANVDILILARYNPDGVAYFQRRLASNFDPNRDHISLASQQTRDIKQTFSAFAPHIAIDMHEFSASRLYRSLYRPGADALFSAAKNLNIHPVVRNMSESLFAPAIVAGLEAGGFRWEPYVTGSSSRVPSSKIAYHEAGSDARIGRNAFGLTQAIAFLCELRGIGIADQHFARRTATGLNMLESILQTSADHAAEILDSVEDAIREFTDSTVDIVVTDSTRDMTVRNWTFVQEESGKLVQVPVRFYSTTPVIANLTRSRPEAYIIPRAWAELAEKLSMSSVEVTTLSSRFRGQVEVLTIATAALAAEYDEGAVRASVTTNSSLIDVDLPAGSFRVSTKQKNAGLAFVALEPENIDSCVSCGIVPLIVGDEYPVYRVLR